MLPTTPATISIRLTPARLRALALLGFAALVAIGALAAIGAMEVDARARAWLDAAVAPRVIVVERAVPVPCDACASSCVCIDEPAVIRATPTPTPTVLFRKLF